MSKASNLERQMLDLINDERTSRGLDPVTLELRLNDSAEDHSDWMLDVDRFSHTGSGNSNPGDRMRDADFDFSGNWTWGENIAWQSERGAPGLSDDVENLHDSLMNSPGHRANILNPDFEVIGIGIERGDYNGWDAVMVTQNFARTSAELELDLPGGSKPMLDVDDITVARVKGSFRINLEKHVTFSDAEGDSPVWYELLDKKGRDNFIMRGEGRIDADTPYRVAAEDFDQIRVGANKNPGDTTLKVRVSDGESVSAWEEFTLTTLSADDWQAMA
ncbi:CAP domain-containing protein [Sedimentitalea todarodis]|uniref:CAP domain-containing protein n=1 Tax=Sedimentitalea todarodis TaxID=1631240 RepID=A0ABU3VAD5_9RHOB|nr:CAP domain-containing protein [Sedimentitalea todarodis]MDU9003138.1 CAP domain-containing protein [Sedimentitalea todarodis]